MVGISLKGNVMSEVVVFDDGDGFILEFPVADGIAMRMYVSDEVAKQMIGIIENKLNGRW